MKNRLFIQTLLGLLIFAYLFSLIISTAHLSQVYRLYDGNLSPYVSLGLAVALELTAFLLSLISTSLRGQVSLWAPVGSTFALGLVWFGNFYAMNITAPDQPIVITGLFSCFVPLSTMLVGKVLGDLFSLRERLFGEDAQAANAPVGVVSAPAAFQDRQERPVMAVSAPAPQRPAPEPAVSREDSAEPLRVDRSGSLEEQVLQVLRQTGSPMDAELIAQVLVSSQEDVKAALSRQYARKRVKFHPSGGYVLA